MEATDDAQSQHQSEAAARNDDATVFVALELSASQRVIAANIPGSEKISKHAIPAWGVDTLLRVLKRWRAQAAKRARGSVKVVVLQEAGRDGFSVHRLLEESGWKAGLSIRPRSPSTAASGG
jgi:transposase